MALTESAFSVDSLRLPRRHTCPDNTLLNLCGRVWRQEHVVIRIATVVCTVVYINLICAIPVPDIPKLKWFEYITVERNRVAKQFLNNLEATHLSAPNSKSAYDAVAVLIRKWYRQNTKSLAVHQSFPSTRPLFVKAS